MTNDVLVGLPTRFRSSIILDVELGVRDHERLVTLEGADELLEGQVTLGVLRGRLFAAPVSGLARVGSAVASARAWLKRALRALL